MPSKGDETRERILEASLALARKVGVDGLTIGSLSERLGMSKSGLFAHFGSREDLMLATLARASSEFEERVARPAIRAPRGARRLVSFMDRWLEWGAEGCPINAAIAEFDDVPGHCRDALVLQERRLFDTLGRLVESARTAGELAHDRPTDELVLELHGLILAYHVRARLLGETSAADTVRRAVRRLVKPSALAEA